MSDVQIKKLFPGGRSKAFTMSYDDGISQDRRFVKMLDKHNIKCTFNISSGILNNKMRTDSGWETVINGKQIVRRRVFDYEVKELYKNHEVAAHGFTHPHLEALSEDMLTYEIAQDKKTLEELVGYPVRGMAYPYGTYNQQVLDELQKWGIEYCRTIKCHEAFRLPEKYLELAPTCHHNNPKLMELAREFTDKTFQEAALFNVWGHTFEFDDYENWDMIESFFEMISGHADIWYATNIEIVDYLKACDQLRFSIDRKCILNPAAFDIWLDIGCEKILIPSGQTIVLKK